jgi:hypothetical protein
MKLKVKSEGRDGVWLVEKSDLKEWIVAQGFEKIHNFVSSPIAIIGADHDVGSVLEDINRAERLAILTGAVQGWNMGHALSLITGNNMEMYDIGAITKADLEIIV